MRLAENLQHAAGRQGALAGQGADVGGDPLRPLTGEGDRFVQASLAGRRGDHLAAGLVDAQADAGGPGADLEPHPGSGDLDQVARGIAVAAEQVHVPARAESRADFKKSGALCG